MRPQPAELVAAHRGNFDVARNAGLDVAQHPWTLVVDSDEVVSPELAREIEDPLGEALADVFLGTLLAETDRELAKAVSPSVVEGVVSFGVWDHFRSLNRGLFRLQDLVWFGSFIFVCLLGTSAILSAKRS